MRQSGNSRVEILETRLNSCQPEFCARLDSGVVLIIGNGLFRLCERFLFVSETRISHRKERTRAVTVGSNHGSRSWRKRLNNELKGGVGVVRPSGPFLAVALKN